METALQKHVVSPLESLATSVGGDNEKKSSSVVGGAISSAKSMMPSFGFGSKKNKKDKEATAQPDQAAVVAAINDKQKEVLKYAARAALRTRKTHQNPHL